MRFARARKTTINPAYYLTEIQNFLTSLKGKKKEQPINKILVDDLCFLTKRVASFTWWDAYDEKGCKDFYGPKLEEYLKCMTAALGGAKCDDKAESLSDV